MGFQLKINGVVMDSDSEEAKKHHAERVALHGGIEGILAAGYAPGGQTPSGWPMKSDALSVHPDEIEAATKEAREMGVPTEFDKAGRPIFTDPRHRKKYCEKSGYYDRNGGYGDPQKS